MSCTKLISSFILLNVLSRGVDDTAIVIAVVIRNNVGGNGDDKGNAVGDDGSERLSNEDGDTVASNSTTAIDWSIIKIALEVFIFFF